MPTGLDLVKIASVMSERQMRTLFLSLKLFLHASTLAFNRKRCLNVLADDYLMN